MKKGFLCLLLPVLFMACKYESETLTTVKGIEKNVSEIDSFMTSYVDTLGIIGTSVSIINDNEIVYSGHFGKCKIDSTAKINNQTIYETASLSKPVFAFFVLKQVEKGVLDLDKPLYQYLENRDIEYDEQYRKITARMVLCHATGLPNWRTETNDSLKIHFESGSRYGYSGEGYEYLKNVLVHLLKTDDKGLDSLFKKEILLPGISTTTTEKLLGIPILSLLIIVIIKLTPFSKSRGQNYLLRLIPSTPLPMRMLNF